MAYIGNSPANVGNYQIVDDISSSFNGSTTSFALASGSITITPAKSGQLLVGVNGVMQEPDDTGTNGFKVSGSNVVFSSAPASGDTFWAVYQGQNVDIGTPSAGTVDTTQLAADAVTGAKIADNAIDSEHYTDGSIDNAHIADNAIDSEHYADGSIDNAHIADDAIDSEHYADGSIDTAHIADDAVTAAKIANSINTDIATGVTAGTTASAALPKAGGTMTGAVVGATDTDTSNSGTVDLDFTDNTNFVLTLTGNITSLTASNEVAGQSGFIVFIQDGTGGRTVALHGDYETAAAAGLTLTSTASATDIVPYVVAASSRILLGTPQLAFA